MEKVEYKSEESELSPGSSIVPGRAMHQSLIDSGSLCPLATAEEGYMQGVPQQLQNEKNYEKFEEDSNKHFEDKSKMFDTAGSNNIGKDCEESEIGVKEDCEESQLLNNGTLDVTWLNCPVSVEAWLDRLVNNYEESELLNIGVELNNKESEDVGVDYEESEAKVGEDYEESKV